MSLRKARVFLIIVYIESPFESNIFEHINKIFENSKPEGK